MNLEHGPEHLAFRDALKDFLSGWSERASADGEAAERFREQAILRGYHYYGIPREYGGAGIELDAVEEAILHEELARVAVPRPRCDPRGEMIATCRSTCLACFAVSRTRRSTLAQCAGTAREHRRRARAGLAGLACDAQARAQADRQSKHPARSAERVGRASPPHAPR